MRGPAKFSKRLVLRHFAAKNRRRPPAEDSRQIVPHSVKYEYKEIIWHASSGQYPIAGTVSDRKRAIEMHPRICRTTHFGQAQSIESGNAENPFIFPPFSSRLIQMANDAMVGKVMRNT